MSVEDLHRLAHATEHRTVALFTPDGRSSCGVMTPVHVLEDALTEIDTLRKELEEEARINGMGGEREARLMAIVAEREAEIARLRLTAAEREAVRFFSLIDGPGNVPVANIRAATLRGLLERLK